MRDIDAPGGVSAFGYTEDDVPALVEGALQQQRLLVGAPRDVTEGDLAQILTASL
jgi:hydroxyacid-oxoacid transhydrogenase